jgi:hypothetical protein
MDTIFKTLRVKATTVSVHLRIFSVRVNKYQQKLNPLPANAVLAVVPTPIEAPS